MTTASKLLSLARGEVRTLVDVGAFVGEFSATAAAGEQDVLFVAVEPVPALAAALRERTDDLANYRVVEAAVSTRRGEADLLVPSSGAYNFSSLQPLREDRRAWRDVTLDERIPVQARPLSEILEQVAPDGDIVVKIDVQGHDVAALESLGRDLRRLRAGVIEAAVSSRRLSYEGSPTRAETVRTLHRHGFEVVRVEPTHPGAYDHDLVFVRRDLTTAGLLWRAAYPVLVAASWLRCLPPRLRTRVAIRTRLRSIRARHGLGQDRIEARRRPG